MYTFIYVNKAMAQKRSADAILDESLPGPSKHVYQQRVRTMFIIFTKVVKIVNVWTCYISRLKCWCYLEMKCFYVVFKNYEMWQNENKILY